MHAGRPSRAAACDIEPLADGVPAASVCTTATHLTVTAANQRFMQRIDISLNPEQESCIGLKSNGCIIQAKLN